MNNYVPIACEKYDILELLILKNEAVIIEYYDLTANQYLTENNRLVDLKTIDSIEYLFTSKNSKIRLDHIRTVNGESFSAGVCKSIPY